MYKCVNVFTIEFRDASCMTDESPADSGFMEWCGSR